jgi:hypothetical protein
LRHQAKGTGHRAKAKKMMHRAKSEKTEEYEANGLSDKGDRKVYSDA